MNLETAQRIYLDNLTKQDSLGDAFAASYREVGETIFGEEMALQPLHLDPEDREMVFELINAQSRFRYFWRVSSVINTREQPDLFKSFLMLLTAWRDGAKYIFDRYEIQNPAFKKEHPREFLDQGLASLETALEERMSQSTKDGKVKIHQEEFDSMSETFAAVLKSILGDDIFERYRDTVNATIFYIRCLDEQLSADTLIQH